MHVRLRLTACDLRCAWCDTVYAFTEAQQSLDDIVAEVRQLGVPLVELTGGEPLLQKKNVIALMLRLIDEGHTVLLETVVTSPIAASPPPSTASVDVKCPGSGESRRMHWDNLDLLTPRDEVKFVTARAYFEYAREVTTTHDLAQRCGAVHFSPAWNLVEPADPAAWISRPGSRCACSCSSTSTSGNPRRDACDAVAPAAPSS